MTSPFKLVHQTEYYKVFEYLCNCFECGMSSIEYNASFSICVSSSGNYKHISFKNEYDIYNGILFIHKPLTEYSIMHYNPYPDRTTVVAFSDKFYKEILNETPFKTTPFYKNKDHHVIALKSKPYWELLHHLILQTGLHTFNTEKLKSDMIVMELLNEVIDELCDIKIIKPISDKLKKLHIETIEKAKAFIISNFQEDLSLSEIAFNSHVSPFHFTRIFKQFTGYSPYRYLLIQRMNFALFLLKNTTKKVSEISMDVGFNSVEHFTNTFTDNYKISPLSFRYKKSNIP